ncbi:hypothetical protein H9Y04_22020 [Streptomyces sp. TRM66268-LWL]|uniref:Uncharacterized protein n=1 Tax=Streptomyces polyasparticus TaxID=2767826 RepID=A0ABR7SIG8_9ACTN|nr:hypothetical protein [Streptomyces polyasparticus]MBC9715233.1 hypothetical protein [Streptomyces polyasparticus]
MAELVAWQRVEVDVDFFGFCLQDADDTAVPVPYPEGRNPAGFLTAYEGRLDVESAGHTHTASMDVEIWDASAPPAQEREAWEEQAEAELACASGEVALWATVAGPMPGYIHLADHAGRWGVRLYCTGRAAVRPLAEQGVPKGIERYLAQFWPLNA